MPFGADGEHVTVRLVDREDVERNEYVVSTHGAGSVQRPRYQQVEAVNRIVERVVAGHPRKGLVWHFLGSSRRS